MDHEARPGSPTVSPAVLGRNSPPTFYRGAGRIDRFRGVTTDVSDRPEDWVASTVTRFGEETHGLTILDTGSALRDEVRADPVSWLGQAHVPSPELRVPLVKLLDAGQRLPVHVHPSDEHARALDVGPHGKAEAWFILEAPADGQVHVGWTRDIDRAELTRWVDQQDVGAMLGTMHAVTVAPGDSVYVPPGTAHAIGAGILLVEVQQPADLSVLLEWKDFLDSGAGAFLGLDAETALGCVSLRKMSDQDVDGLVGRGALDEPVDSALLPSESQEFFSATLVGPGSILPREYRTLVVVSGSGRLAPVASSGGQSIAVAQGVTLAVPAAAGPLRLEGSPDLRGLAFGAGRAGAS
ncbi:MAG TPA: class I mannose-6-phosphate isomerase [Cellulomonas sp.]|uniref:class I mannose-6-phosphate isomerase n=1 Tax=Cellulomonas sp. TaxID=40001 RepID=UPI002E36DACF|nr:class I mannose-6-phosphate isomerase [Cellulomonas sp.]HEX5331838.1 class I mannose-6-phosphate isomerase [Cellulomonas sp.]